MTMDPLKTISKAQKIRLEKLGATVSSTTVTATEEQLWRAPIVGEQRILLEKRGCLVIGTAGGDANVLQLGGENLQLGGEDLTLGA